MISYLKWIGAGLVVSALILAGWQASEWRTRAAEASIARAELRAEMTKRIQAEVDGREIQRKLDIANAKIDAKVKAFQTKVKANEASLGCLVPDPVASELQKLRQGQ